MILDGYLASQEVPYFYTSQRVFTVFTKGHYWHLFWARWFHFAPLH